jgi:ribonuclease Z
MHKAFEVTVLGTSSASPTKYRHPSAQFVRMEGEYFLIDCGEGTQLQLTRMGLRMHRIRFILITHLHGDHFFGLPGLITSMGLHGRSDKLTIAGPAALQPLLEAILACGETTLPFEIEYIVCDPNRSEEILVSPAFKVVTVPLKHRIPCTGYILKENGPELKLNVAQCEKLKIPVQSYEAIKSGLDYVQDNGTIIPNAELTLPGNKNRSYAYISDTIYDENIAVAVRDCTVLYHEATFLHELEARAKETYHTTALQAGKIAAMAGVSQLLIGHFSARYNDADELQTEARNVFANTEVAEEGKTYTV